MADKPISWNEIRERAVNFVAEWRGETKENAEAQTFWNDWFEVFGIRRRRFVQFERKAQRQSTGGRGRLDAFWDGQIAVEHKSAGESLVEAEAQALDYLQSFGETSQPRLVVTSDFARFRVLDLETDTVAEFALDELPEQIERFGFIAGYESRTFRPEDGVNIQAAELMGGLYDDIQATRYPSHRLKVFLVRLMFLFFGDDTGIWEKGLFQEFLETRTSEDGSDTGALMGRLFSVLDTPEAGRTTTLDEVLARFPYVNGGLFREQFDPPDFNSHLRARMIECSGFDWSKVSPAVFGSMFQSVMDADQRRAIGAHYTREQNILKLIEPLFLDELRAEFSTSQHSARRLEALHDRLARLTFFDPAAGCGNFLEVAYRELRRLEFDILKRLADLRGASQQHLDIAGFSALSRVNVDQFYAIELEEFPALIARTALYLVDHLENMRLSKQFGQYFARIPLTVQAHVRVGNALAIDWAAEILPAAQCSYVLGNPPFVGKKARSPEQQADMERVFGRGGGFGTLDYVCAWYRKTADYIRGHDTRAAFVSTNSIVEGEQVEPLWTGLFARGMAIDFAHRTFNWSSDARGRAHVHVVIIGFSDGGKRPVKLLFDHPDPNGDGSDTRVVQVGSISPYLVDGPPTIVEKRRSPLGIAPTARFGNMPNDGQHLILEVAERATVLATDPIAAGYVRELICADEMLDGRSRYCLWLLAATPLEISQSPVLRERVSATRQYRVKSKRPATVALASTPALFGEIRQPETRYLCLPRHSAQSRRYIPMAYFEPECIAHDSTMTIADASLYHFGVLNSEMFMTWVRTVAGRIRNDFRLSTELVYNGFPWPDASAAQVEQVSRLGEAVLATRAAHPDAPLTVLYDRASMPADLAHAHLNLDRAVEGLFVRRRLATELERQSVLLERYRSLLGQLGLETTPERAPAPSRRRAH